MTSPLPRPLPNTPRPLSEVESERVKHLSQLQYFLATAPTRWLTSSNPLSEDQTAGSSHSNLNRFRLPNGEYVSCIFWNGLYHISGTDIVRALVFRFEAFSRPVKNMKKFEEGVFSDLRNLKAGRDACLEEPKSPFLELLFRNACIRTQKKQKVFYWFSVPHDRLFLDALERDLKREKMGLEPTTAVCGEPARSFRYDPKRSLFEQFAGASPGLEESLVNHEPLESTVSRPGVMPPTLHHHRLGVLSAVTSGSPELRGMHHLKRAASSPAVSRRPADFGPDRQDFLFPNPMLEGSPVYKRRKRRTTRDICVQHDGRILDPSNDSEKYNDEAQDYSLLPEDAPSDTHRAPPTEMSISSCRSGVSSALFFAVRSSHTPSYTLQHQGVEDIPRKYERMRETPDRFSSGVHADANHEHETGGGVGHQKPGRHSASPCLSSMTAERAYSCPLFSCGRLFKRYEHLKRHVRTHTQERPYECTWCSKRFSRMDNLNQHLKLHVKSVSTEPHSRTCEGNGAGEDDVGGSFAGETGETDALTQEELPTHNASILSQSRLPLASVRTRQSITYEEPPNPLGDQGLYSQWTIANEYRGVSPNFPQWGACGCHGGQVPTQSATILSTPPLNIPDMPVNNRSSHSCNSVKETFANSAEASSSTLVYASGLQGFLV